MLLMTNNYKFEYVYRLSYDNVIIVSYMLHRDIQLYCLSLRAYHCRIWYLVTIFIDDFPHCIKKKKKNELQTK